MDNERNEKLVVTADPKGVEYSEVRGNNPQNTYRSYDKIAIFTDPQDWNSSEVSHERLSHYDVIKRANGGGPSDTSMVGKFVNDSKSA